MSLRSIIFAIVLAAAAVTIGRALIAGDNLGAVEYIAGVALVVGLVVLAFRASRRGLHARS